MAPAYRVSWSRRVGKWRSDCGELVEAPGKRPRRKTVYFEAPKEDRATAEAMLRDFVKAQEGRTFRPGDLSGDDLARLYLLHSAEVSKPRTVEGHREMLRAFCGYPAPEDPTRYGLRQARMLGAKDLRRIAKDWEGRRYSPHYRDRLIRTVKACWKWAHDDDVDRPARGLPRRLVPEDTMEGVKGVAIPDAPERYAERSEIAGFLRHLRTRNAANPSALYRRFGRQLALMVRVIVHTGARPSELCSAEWHEFDREKGIIVVPVEKMKTGRKTGRGGTIFLSPTLARALARLRASELRHPTHLFAHKRGRGGAGRGALRDQGEPWASKALTRAIYNLREEAIAAGVELESTGDNRFVLYRLRHTFASDAIMGGASMVETGAVMRTSARMIEKVYGKVLEKHALKVAEAVRSKRRERVAGK